MNAPVIWDSQRRSRAARLARARRVADGKRVEAARALLAWLQTDPTKSGDPDQLIVGDLNAYAKEDPIRLMKEEGFRYLGEGSAEAAAASGIQPTSARIQCAIDFQCATRTSFL